MTDDQANEIGKEILALLRAKLTNSNDAAMVLCGVLWQLWSANSSSVPIELFIARVGVAIYELQPEATVQ